MPAPRALRLTVLAVGAAVTATASASGDAGEPRAFPLDQPTIEAACGGGVTGVWTGVTITPDDRVYAWSAPSANALRVETERFVEPHRIIKVRLDLRSAGFRRITMHDAGNLTCTLQAGGHRISWKLGDPSVPTAISAVHERVAAFAGGERVPAPGDPSETAQ